MPSCASDLNTRLLFLVPTINPSTCKNKCWHHYGSRCVFAICSLGSLGKERWWSSSLPFPICHLFSLCLCYMQNSVLYRESCKIPASQSISSGSLGTPEDFFLCCILPAGSGGLSAAKSFQLLHYELEHQPRFTVLLLQYFVFGCSLHYCLGAYVYVFSTVRIFCTVLSL